jgi:hypothetical protein
MPAEGLLCKKNLRYLVEENLLQEKLFWSYYE